MNENEYYDQLAWLEEEKLYAKYEEDGSNGDRSSIESDRNFNNGILYKQDSEVICIRTCQPFSSTQIKYKQDITGVYVPKYLKPHLQTQGNSYLLRKLRIQRKNKQHNQDCRDDWNVVK